MAKQPESHRRFHEHLDVCKRCREQPFNLCTAGETLLKKCADDDAIAGVRKILERGT